jgi:outer membrane receptor protein involved in Fe transport
LRGRNILNDRSISYEAAIGNFFITANSETGRTFGIGLNIDF